MRSPRRFQKLDTFSTQRDKLFHQSLSKARHEKSSSKLISHTKNIALTSSVEIIGRGASREVLAADAFFRRLDVREPAFLAAASGDLGTTAASCEGGSSIAGASTMGAVATYFFGFSLSLEKKQKSKTICTSQKKEKYINKSAKNSRVQEVEKLLFIL
jgi:hypothetical protein